MPLLAGLLLSLFTGLASFFTQWFAKKAAFGAAAVITFAALTGGLYLTLSVLISTVVSSMPQSGVLMSIVSMALPAQLPAAIAVYFGVDTAVALYAWNCENLKLASYVT